MKYNIITPTIVALFLSSIAWAYIAPNLDEVKLEWRNSDLVVANEIGMALVEPTDEKGFVPVNTWEVAVDVGTSFYIAKEFLRPGLVLYFGVRAIDKYGLKSAWTYRQNDGELALIDLVPPEGPVDVILNITITNSTVNIYVNEQGE